MHCLMRTGYAFMEFEHREAVIFSPNKRALESLAERINRFTSDAYTVIHLRDVSKHAKSVIFCHREDSDINYSIINDDKFLEDTTANETSLGRTVAQLIKEHGDGFHIKRVPVKKEVSKYDIAEVVRAIGSDFVRPVNSYDDFCILESGYRRMIKRKNSPEFYQSTDFKRATFSFQGYVLD